MSSSAFLSGMRAFRRGAAYDSSESYEWRRGWRHAEFSARPSLSPPPETARTMGTVDTGARG